MASFAIREARADELPTLVAIDDEASEMYMQAGVELVLDKSHPFVVAESVRWADAIRKGLTFVVADGQNALLGFCALRLVDGAPYLDQLAVRPSAMRRGIGSTLLRRAMAWSGARPLWLTTYMHLPWNRPFYEKHGFEMVAERECGAELQAILQEQRAVLPDPGERIAMVRRSAGVPAATPGTAPS